MEDGILNGHKQFSRGLECNVLEKIVFGNLMIRSRVCMSSVVYAARDGAMWAQTHLQHMPGSPELPKASIMIPAAFCIL